MERKTEGNWTLLALKEHFEKLFKEQDTRYEERFKAQEKAVVNALAESKEQTKAKFEASEKAIQKAEENSEKWRANANEWRAAMQDREAKFAPRVEMENRLKAHDEKINELREGTSRSVGAGNQAASSWANSQWLIGIGVIIILGLLALYFK